MGSATSAGMFDVTNRIRSDEHLGIEGTAVVPLPLGNGPAGATHPSDMARIYALASQRAQAMIDRRRWHELLDRLLRDDS
jgi:hypothetical protein